MTDLLKIAKECGAVVMPKGTQIQPVTLKHAAVVLTPEELHATVEKVCLKMIDALEQYNTGAGSIAFEALESYYSLMGKENE